MVCARLARAIISASEPFFGGAFGPVSTGTMGLDRMLVGLPFVAGWEGRDAVRLVTGLRMLGLGLSVGRGFGDGRLEEREGRDDAGGALGVEEVKGFDEGAACRVEGLAWMLGFGAFLTAPSRDSSSAFRFVGAVLVALLP